MQKTFILPLDSCSCSVSMVVFVEIDPRYNMFRGNELVWCRLCRAAWNVEIEDKTHNCLGAQNSMRRLILPHIVFFHFESLIQLSPSFRTFGWRRSSMKPQECDLALEYGTLWTIPKWVLMAFPVRECLFFCCLHYGSCLIHIELLG